MSGTSILVTGGNGFVGRHLVRALVRRGHAVTLLQRSSWTAAGVLQTLAIDRFESQAIEATLAGRSFDWMVHLAAYGVDPDHTDFALMQQANVAATRQLVQVAAGWPARAVFVAGSGSEYAPTIAEQPVTEEQPLATGDGYGPSKAQAGAAALEVAQAAMLPLIVGRIFNVYGPGEASHRLLPNLYAKLRARERVPLTSGSQRRDFLYVLDVVEAIIAILDNLDAQPRQAALNVASGKPVTVRCFCEIVARELRAPAELLGFGELSLRPGESSYFVGDPARLEAWTGWRPAYDLASGVAHAIAALEQEQAA